MSLIGSCRAAQLEPAAGPTPSRVAIRGAGARRVRRSRLDRRTGESDPKGRYLEENHPARLLLFGSMSAMRQTPSRRQGVLVTGKRYQVFSIKEKADKSSGDRGAVWVKAGSAWVNRDGSLNVYLDVLPLDGRLHVREALEKREGVDERASAVTEPIAAEAAGVH